MLYQKMTQKLVTVGTTAIPFPAPASGDEVQNPEKIIVQSMSTNTGKIFIGKDPTNDYSTPSFEIIPTADIDMPYNLDEQLQLISTVAAQKVVVTYLADEVRK